MHDDILLISFTTKPRIQNANVSQRTGIEKKYQHEMWNKRAYVGERRGGETDQQNVIMHKAH